MNKTADPLNLYAVLPNNLIFAFKPLLKVKFVLYGIDLMITKMWFSSKVFKKLKVESLERLDVKIKCFLSIILQLALLILKTFIPPQ